MSLIAEAVDAVVRRAPTHLPLLSATSMLLLAVYSALTSVLLIPGRAFMRKSSRFKPDEDMVTSRADYFYAAFFLLSCMRMPRRREI
eukprot:6192039-Pleurochrysis_carterae.AAC.1